MKVSVLLYHDLDSPDLPNEKQGAAAQDTVVRADSFESQLRFLSDSGYKTASTQEYLSQRSNPQWGSDKRLIITFDDGHHSNYFLALPRLKKFGFAATFFIVAARIGEEFHLTREQIREMAAQGMEIASHGLTHTYLPLLEADGINYELRESKRWLEEAAAVPITSFAYPGGHYDRTVLDALPSAGYLAACSCLQGLNGERTNPFLLRRLELRRRYTEQDVARLFDPTTIAFYQGVDFMKGMLRRTLGLKRYTAMRAKCYKWYRFKR